MPLFLKGGYAKEGVAWRGKSAAGGAARNSEAKDGTDSPARHRPTYIAPFGGLSCVMKLCPTMINSTQNDE